MLRENVIENEESFSAVDNNFMMAFAIESYATKVNLVDTRYVKFTA